MSEDVFQFALDRLDEMIEMMSKKNEEDEKLIKEQFHSVQLEALNRVAAGPPQMIKAFAISGVDARERFIGFYTEDLIAEPLCRFGELLRPDPMVDYWKLYVDPRYSFAQVHSYLQDLELIHDAGL